MPDRAARTSFRSRQVATALRKHREEAGLSTVQAAKAIGVSQSKISRIETGASTLQETDVAVLLGLYRVPAETRDELMETFRRAGERGWWSSQPGLPQLWRGLMDVEDQAVRIQNYEALVVPGLLQTADYCRALIAGMTPVVTAAETDTLVATRLGRQALLTRPDAPQFIAVLDESALRRPIGAPGVLRRQLQHLISVAEQPNVLLRLVPIAAGAHDGLRGTFTIMEFGDGTGLVHVENQITGLFLEDPAEVTGYQMAMGSILNAAHAPDASVELLARIVDES